MSKIVINTWKETIASLEDAFRNGSMTDDQVKERLHDLFEHEIAEMMWSRLYSARKHNNWD